MKLKKLREENINNDELNLVKNYIYGTYLRSFDGPMALAERYRSAKDLNLNFEYYTESLNEMMKQTPQQIKRNCKQIF